MYFFASVSISYCLHKKEREKQWYKALLIMATQTCDRTITGRNFDYGQALSIIQDEEYLEDEDFDEIRFYR